MEQWLIDLLVDIDGRLTAIHGEGAPVHWSTRRRMAYDTRWPSGRQNEAHFDASLGDTTKLELMKAEFAAIKAAIPKIDPAP